MAASFLRVVKLCLPASLLLYLGAFWSRRIMDAGLSSRFVPGLLLSGVVVLAVTGLGWCLLARLRPWVERQSEGQAEFLDRLPDRYVLSLIHI